MNTRYKKFMVITLAVIGVVLVFVLSATYVFHFDSPALHSVRKALRLPAIIVDGRWISISEIEENSASIKQFYDNQDFSSYGIRIDFETEDGKKRLVLQERKMINKLIEDYAIEKLARDWDISISDEAVQSAMDRPMNEMGTRDNVEKKLDDLYGWTLEDFGEKVVYGQLLREKVAAKFEEQNAITDAMRSQINAAKKELDDGRLFEDVAMKYSDGSTAQEGGIMGWFGENQLQDEVGKNVSELEAGQYSDVLETPLGLHIVRVNQISDEEGEKRLVHVSQVIVKKRTFADYLNEQIATFDVNVFLPTYEWDAASGMIIFADSTLSDFEEAMREEAIAIQQRELNK